MTLSNRTGSPRTRTGVAIPLIILAIAAVTWHRASDGKSTGHSFVPGQRLVHRLEYFSASAADFNVLMRGDAAEGNEQAIFTTVGADLETTVLEANAEGALLAVVFRDLEVQVVFNGDLGQPGSGGGNSGRPAAAPADDHRSAGPNRRRQTRSRGQHAGAYFFVRALLATTQVVFPDEPTPSWETRWKAIRTASSWRATRRKHPPTGSRTFA